MNRSPKRAILLVLAAVAGCSSSSPKPPRHTSVLDALPPERRDAAMLGREVFRLVDRAADYRGSHLGHPPVELRVMGVDSLAPLFVRRIRVVNDSSVVTVAFRQPAGQIGNRKPMFADQFAKLWFAHGLVAREPQHVMSIEFTR